MTLDAEVGVHMACGAPAVAAFTTARGAERRVRCVVSIGQCRPPAIGIASLLWRVAKGRVR